MKLRNDISSDFLQGTALFHNIAPEDMSSILDCLQAAVREYKKEDTLYHAGDTAEAVGLVLSGGVYVESLDVWGRKSILNHIGTGQLFAETYAMLPEEPLMVNVTAAENSRILFLNAGRLIRTCPGACPFHNQIIRNLLTICAQKNLHLSRRIFFTSSKSIRGRVMAYLSGQAKQNRSYDFTIPFNRQQLADYLDVDRSALSNELSKMQKEGLISYRKNKFSVKL